MYVWSLDSHRKFGRTHPITASLEARIEQYTIKDTNDDKVNINSPFDEALLLVSLN
jgi:hypothetical protein